MSHTDPTPSEDAEAILSLTPQRIVLEPEAYDAFVAMLDEPVEPCPKLQALLQSESRLDR